VLIQKRWRNLQTQSTDYAEVTASFLEQSNAVPFSKIGVIGG